MLSPVLNVWLYPILLSFPHRPQREGGLNTKVATTHLDAEVGPRYSSGQGWEECFSETLASSFDDRRERTKDCPTSLVTCSAHSTGINILQWDVLKWRHPSSLLLMQCDVAFCLHSSFSSKVQEWASPAWWPCEAVYPLLNGFTLPAMGFSTSPPKGYMSWACSFFLQFINPIMKMKLKYKDC